MKRKTLYTALLITTSNLMMGCLSYGSEAGRKALPKMDQGIIKEAETKYEGTKERVKKREEGRKVQKKGKKIKKEVEGVTGPLSSVGTTVGMVASASGDPQAKAAAAAFKLAISAVDTLGTAISEIVIAVGRYQERSQQIFSTVEVLLEDLQKSIEKKKSLEKKLKELLVVEKLPEPSQSSSRLKKLGKGVVDAAKTVEIKAHQAVDVLTNEKSKREEKIKAIQAELRVENENYAEIIRLLQIKLLQDAAKELDKHIHITDTLVGLEKDAVFYQKAKEGIPASESKQTAEIEAKEAQIKNDLVF